MTRPDFSFTLVVIVGGQVASPQPIADHNGVSQLLKSDSVFAVSTRTLTEVPWLRNDPYIHPWTLFSPDQRLDSGSMNLTFNHVVERCSVCLRVRLSVRTKSSEINWSRAGSISFSSG